MDIADITAERMEFLDALSVKNSRKPEGPVATGFCLNCGEPLEPGVRWCNRDCSTDWSKRDAVRAR